MRFFLHTFTDFDNAQLTRVLFDDGQYVWTIHEESRFWKLYEEWLAEGNEPEEWTGE